MSSSSIIIFVILLGSVTPSTRFHVNGILSCSLEQFWCFLIELREIDTLRVTDDRIDTFGGKCTYQPSYDYELKGVQDGDGFKNKEYEIGVTIKHNCTLIKGHIRKVSLPVFYESVDAETFVFTWNLKLAQNGALVEDYWS